VKVLAKKLVEVEVSMLDPLGKGACLSGEISASDA
jgi:hypothetical protein